MRGNHRGTTLVELLAAIAIAGLVLLSAILLLNGVVDTTNRMVSDADSSTTTATTNAELRDVLGAALATLDTTQRFDATPQSMSFSTRCPSPEGWLTACRAMLVLDGPTLRARFGARSWRTIARYPPNAILRFHSASRPSWTSSWSSSATLPDAVGVVLSDDTLIYAIGPSRD